ncbi:dual specificity protein phosphatase 18-like [Glandiceps talaboti]
MAMDMSQITDYLYLSSGAAACSGRNLRLKGITFIVNVTPTSTKRPTGLDIQTMQVPINDVPAASLSPYFDSVADKIREEKVRGGKILVHCVAGVSRSSTMCIVYMMKHESLSLRKAHDYIKARRSVIRPNLGFWKQLINYEMRLYGRNTVRIVPSYIGLIPDIYMV